MTTELFVVDTGSCCIDEGMLGSGVSVGKRVHTPFVAYLLVLDGGEVVLVDTGVSDGHVQDPLMTWRGTELEQSLIPVVKSRDTLSARLRSCELEAGDITHVINTHLHFDHAGNNRLFRQATFFVQRSHHEWALGNPSCPNEYWADGELDYELVDGETELWTGVSVFLTPGHVPGHQSVRVDIGNRSFIICGDAIFSRRALEIDRWDVHESPVLARETAKGLTALEATEGSMLLFGHDMEQIAKVALAPDRLAPDGETVA